MSDELEHEGEAKRRLCLSYINIAQRGEKSHLGKMIGDQLALILFDRPKAGETTVAVWDVSEGQAITSKNLPFSLGMLWDWDWRAEALEQTFEELLITLDRPVPGP